MNKLTNFSMKNIAAVLIIIAMLVGGGIYSASTLKMENMPDISFPVVLVSTTYQASPKDVMTEVTKPIEDKIANMEGIDNLTSTSSDNMSTVIVQFKQNVDVDKKKQDIEGLVQDVKLPASSGRPKASTFGFASIPAYYLAVYADNGMSQTELDKLYEDQIKPSLEGINGIDHINSIGARETSLDIEMNADALASFGLTPAQVSTALKSTLSNGAIGTVDFNGNTKVARVTSDIDSLFNLENMQIPLSNGSMVTLNQVAKVQAITDSEFIARLDNKPALGIHLFKTSDANAVDFSNETDALIKKWETTMPDITFKSVYNSADQVKESVNGLLKEGIMGALLASLMILVFLRNVRMTLIVLVSIPLSILITLLVISQLGITLNTMTLGGIFIAVGRVVDDSIVVIENIYASLQKAQERNESVIKLATKQVSMAITSSTLATVGVFAPIGMVSGIVGELFRPFAITVACALMASLLVALTVIPMMAKLLVLRNGKIPHHDETQKGKVTVFYEKVLKWSLSHRIKTLLISGLLFVVSLAAIIPNLAVSFIPGSTSERQMYFEVKLPYETSIESTDQISKQLEAMLQEAKDKDGQPLFTFVEALVGYNGKDEQVAYVSEIFTEVNEKANPDQVKKDYKEFILYELPKGSEVTPKTLAGGGGGISSTDFSYSLKGDNQLLLEQASVAVKQKLQDFPELSEVEDSLSDSKTQVQINVDQSKARTLGLTVSQVKDAARSWIMKDQLGDIQFDNQTYTTTIQLSKEDKNSMDKIGQIPLRTSSNSTVYLNEVAKIEEVEAPVALQRENKEQVVKITAKIDSVNKSAISNKVSAELGKLELPDGVSREVKGVSADINESFTQLFVAMAAAIFVVYLVMVLAFGNAGAPFAILFSLPLAAIGGLLGLFISGQSLDVTSMIGFMMLIGIVVTNAIVLIDRAQQLREEGYTVRHALVEAGLVRLRPIIMTAGATIVAMLPLALGFSKGTLISKGLAVVVIGGLTTSTILTLIVVPVVYELIEVLKGRVSQRFNRKSKAEKSIEV
ncbi:efflux RND transporter permease subunit [Paenibacillus radicis (ex Xue et al. 2023)]|uniref:Efflux RND transporter permease subunit n=1 Tax=Paenibacillus radicis (ex Xue et al. 2023) TaxID=2972489 RepID=A0ABT1YPH6_9BACL|nr:efflux RND transporter permease subunit [Paenibacillus radicis (ex Xue et al. 2023)]MCR8635079.1 efflux RND transporter permease subunit [Paenibacillus radicis (ex Xue et al. 2023)]